MEKLVRDAGLADKITLDSAGTGNWHVGELPDERSREYAALRGYDLTHRARQFVTSDFARFDLVVAMDRSNLGHLQRLATSYRGDPPPIRLLRSFDRDAPEFAEVPDPYAGGRDDFEQVLDICERACAGLLAHARTHGHDRP